MKRSSWSTRAPLFSVLLAVLAHADGEAYPTSDNGPIASSAIQGEIGGTQVVWHPLTLTFHGPATHEAQGQPNPFLDYRLDVELTNPSGITIPVQGFYDGDGNGGGTGDVWRVRFTANEPGTWTWRANFREGTRVAIDLDPNAGSPAFFDGATGAFTVAPRDPQAEGFLRWGKLRYVGRHYLKFYHGPYFLKLGTNSPENLLGYMGFDNTFDQGGDSTPLLVSGLHLYPPHVDDFGPQGLGSSSDPYFVSEDHGYDSRGLIGALNYLASRRVNAIYFLPMNLGGDGQETYPFLNAGNNRYDKTHYDISKLAQWNQVFEHAQRKRLLLHFVLGETELENETWLDGGQLGVERKLFYREMVARFGHNLAIKWNLGEEFDFSTQLLFEFADYLDRLDPYNHPIAWHTHRLPAGGDDHLLSAAVGSPLFSATSFQLWPWTMEEIVERWREESAAAGRPWVVEMDESAVGLEDNNADELRKKVLWDVLFSGGAGVEWYFGYPPPPLGGDLDVEDFRTREEMWDYSWYAQRFFYHSLPFWKMAPMDDLVSGEEQSSFGSAEVFALIGEFYAVYYPDASETGVLDLSTTSGNFKGRWLDPRTGVWSPRWTLSGGAPYKVPEPPHSPGEDWVLYVRRG